VIFSVEFRSGPPRTTRRCHSRRPNPAASLAGSSRALSSTSFEKLNGRLLQFKFPEFVKTNGAVLLAVPAIAVMSFVSHQTL